MQEALKPKLVSIHNSYTYNTDTHLRGQGLSVHAWVWWLVAVFPLLHAPAETCQQVNSLNKLYLNWNLPQPNHLTSLNKLPETSIKQSPPIFCYHGNPKESISAMCKGVKECCESVHQINVSHFPLLSPSNPCVPLTLSCLFHTFAVPFSISRRVIRLGRWNGSDCISCVVQKATSVFLQAVALERRVLSLWAFCNDFSVTSTMYRTGPVWPSGRWPSQWNSIEGMGESSDSVHLCGNRLAGLGVLSVQCL